MDYERRKSLRSTATTREANTQRRRMGLTYIRKGFCGKRIGSAMLQFSVTFLSNWDETRVVPHLMLGTVGHHHNWRTLPNVACHWTTGFSIRLDPTDFAAHVSHGNTFRHPSPHDVPDVASITWDFDAWLRRPEYGTRLID